VGLAGLTWGASRFYAALDVAFARVFHAPSARTFAAQTVRGLAIVGLFLGVIIASAVLVSLASYIRAFIRQESTVAVVWQLATQGLGFVLQLVAIAAVLRYVPPYRPSWRALGPPAIAVAVVLSVFTNVFVLIQARLVGALELFSGFAFVLATMIWLSIGFQVLLLGAVWTHERDPGTKATKATIAPGQSGRAPPESEPPSPTGDGPGV